MIRLLTLFILVTSTYSSALAQAPLKGLPKKVGAAASHAEHAVASKIVQPYLKPGTTHLSATPAMQEEILHQLPASNVTNPTFTQRPIDKLRHSISPQTIIIGSEKKEAFARSLRSGTNWKTNQKLYYYSPEDRARLRELLASDLATIKLKRPDVSASQYALTDYIYAQTKNKTDAYLTPLYKDLLRMEAETLPKIVPYATGAAFSPHERRLDPRRAASIGYDLTKLIDASGKLLTFLPNDPYLQAVYNFSVGVYQVFNPLLGSFVGNVKLKRPDGRVFNFDEFFLFSPEGKDYVLHSEIPWSEQVAEEVGSLHYLADKAQQKSAELLERLPQNWHIAVLNDDLPPLQNFILWAKQGHLGAQAKVSTFEDGNDLLKSMRDGAHYDLILTDILVPNGGRGMMPALRKIDPQVPVFGMSRYTRQKVGALNLFETGMDGYLPYTPALNDPEVGYLEYLQAVDNYLQHKVIKGWER